MTPHADTEAPCCVLYVDDHPVNISLMQAIFGLQTGLNLLHAGSAQQALTMRWPVKPVLLLLDLHLPDIHGSQLLAMLRARPGWAALPAVAVTADHDFDVFEAGFREIWRKPLDLRHVLGRLVSLTDPAASPPDASDGAGSPAPGARRPFPAPRSLHAPSPQ